MEKLNAEQILEIVEENIRLGEWGYGEFDFKGYMDTLGEIQEVDQYGGEGEGDDYWRVFYFPQHDVYIKCEGWYSSYEGADFDTYGKEVFPKQKTITVYE